MPGRKAPFPANQRKHKGPDEDDDDASDSDELSSDDGKLYIIHCININVFFRSKRRTVSPLSVFFSPIEMMHDAKLSRWSLI